MAEPARVARDSKNGFASYVRTPRGRLSSGSPNPIDAHIGWRIRLRRTLLGRTMEDVAAAMGVTFQQIQKYESGLNRVSASRLWDLGQALGCPVEYFFEEVSSTAAAASPRHLAVVESEPETAPALTINTRESMLLARAYSQITRTEVRQRILSLATSLASEPGEAPPA